MTNLSVDVFITFFMHQSMIICGRLDLGLGSDWACLSFGTPQSIPRLFIAINFHGF